MHTGYASPHHSAGAAGVPAPGPVAPLQQQLEHASQKAGFVDDKYKPRQQVCVDFHVLCLHRLCMLCNTNGTLLLYSIGQLFPNDVFLPISQKWLPIFPHAKTSALKFYCCHNNDYQ